MIKKYRNTMFVGIFILLVLSILLGLVGVNETVEKTVGVVVYENNDVIYKNTNIRISGNLKRSFLLSKCSFIGTFAIEFHAPSCGEGIEAKIEWHDGYQSINFFSAGDFTNLGIKKIEIDEQMEDITIVLEDGVLIRTE